LLSWTIAMAAIALLTLSVARMAPPSTAFLAAWALAGAALLLIDRQALALCLRRWRRAGRLQRRAAILGAGPIGRKLLHKLLSAADPDVRIIGVYDDRATRVSRSCFGHPIRGTSDTLLTDIRAGAIDSVFVALPLSADWRLAEIMNKLSLASVDVRLCADAFGFHIGECGVSHVDGLTMLDVCRRPLQGWQLVAKQVEDKLLASFLLLLIAPMLLAVALLVKLDSPGPALFRQKRYGLNNQLFEVLKFRTLYHNARDMNAERLCGKNDPRVTRVGAILRRTMIDELPQLINVLRGEMSIVGPRPHATAAKAGGLLYQEVVKYYDARHRMRPGITGLAQCNGWRGETRTFEEIQQRVAHDLYYIQHWSILLDFQIILRTAIGMFVGFVPRKLQNIPTDHAVPLADLGRPRSAA
jgi:Undecaprenyl-phosphate glucose phosphotransferase